MKNFWINKNILIFFDEIDEMFDKMWKKRRIGNYGKCVNVFKYGLYKKFEESMKK